MSKSRIKIYKHKGVIEERLIIVQKPVLCCFFPFPVQLLVSTLLFKYFFPLTIHPKNKTVHPNTSYYIMHSTNLCTVIINDQYYY